MKILHIINSLETGGAEKLILESLHLYKESGIYIEVLSLSNLKTNFWQSIELENNIKITGLTSFSIYNPILIFKIIPFLRKFDLAHIHLFPSLYWVVIAKLISFSKIKLIFTEHSATNRRRGISFFKIFDKIFYKKLDKIACISNGVKHNLIKHLNFEENIIVIHNGINLDKFNKFNKFNNFNFFKESDIKLLQVSSFRNQKDHKTLIKCLVLLPDYVKLILVGSGPLLEDYKKLVYELSINERVLFLGNRYDIPDLINYSDIVILSSKTEGFGLAIVEGMAMEKPVIASNIIGLSEIVENYGLLFEIGSEIDLAFQITRLINDNIFYLNCSKKCLNRSKDFNIKLMVKNYIELYNQICIKNI